MAKKKESGFGEWLKRNWKWLLALAVLAFPITMFFLGRIGATGRCQNGDLKCVLSEFHGVDMARLFVNIPPEASRYPGTILLAPENIRLERTASNNRSLERGTEYTFTGSFREQSSAGGSVVNTVLDAITKSESIADVEIRIDPGRTVEADLQFLLGKVNESTLVDRLKEKRLANVIHKAFEGEVFIKGKFADTLSAEAFAKEKEQLTALAGSLNVSFGTGLRRDVTWKFKGVYAFVAVDVTTLLEKFEFEEADAPSGPMDTARVVLNLLSFDPLEIPDLRGTLEEIGPAAAPNLMKVIVAGDSLTRSRGLRILPEVPESARPKVDDPRVSLISPDASERGWAVLQIAESASVRKVELLSNALADDVPAVRLLAAQAIGDLGTKAVLATPALQEATQDTAPDVRQAASRALVIVTTPAGEEVGRANSALESGEPSRHRASLGLVKGIARDDPDEAIDILRKSLASPDVSVKLEALRLADELDGLSDSLAQEVKFLKLDPDPRVKRRADVVNRRLRQGGSR